ncbi:MAG: hypothetical protein JEY94_07965 [Melioribacteraceae bacterium]|nr:hypothetical protein [Melioribacteraceae bacterium]
MKIIILLISFLFVGFVSESNQTPINKYRSTAYDLDSDKFIYTENHAETYNGSKLVKSVISYKDTNEIVFTTKEMFFNADSTKPDFVLKDSRDGYLEGSELLSDNKIRVFTRSTFDEPISEDTLQIDETFVIDGGLTFFFRENWEEILNDEIISFYFVAPAKLDYYKFRVSKYEELVLNDKDAVTLELELNSWFLRQFVSSIFITYDKKTKTIIKYEGISNINNELGKSHFVKIDF